MPTHASNNDSQPGAAAPSCSSSSSSAHPLAVWLPELLATNQLRKNVLNNTKKTLEMMGEAAWRSASVNCCPPLVRLTITTHSTKTGCAHIIKRVAAACLYAYHSTPTHRCSLEALYGAPFCCASVVAAAAVVVVAAAGAASTRERNNNWSNTPACNHPAWLESSSATAVEQRCWRSHCLLFVLGVLRTQRIGCACAGVCWCQSAGHQRCSNVARRRC